jgi:Putative restriction endonuclease
MPLSPYKPGWSGRSESSVNPKAPIDVAPEDNPTNEPEPDLVVLTKPSREFRDANPTTADLRLVVEISDSTLGFDLTAKAELYARAAIIEYWVVDVAARRLIVHRDPREGLYRSVTLYAEQEILIPWLLHRANFGSLKLFEAEPRITTLQSIYSLRRHCDARGSISACRLIKIF